MTLYYEAHVTIEPVFDDRLTLFAEIADQHSFRVADLLMKKRTEDTAERSQYDSFCTGRGNDYTELLGRMVRLVMALTKENFQVWRYKIEDTILDSRYEDLLRLLPSEKGSNDAHPDYA